MQRKREVQEGYNPGEYMDPQTNRVFMFSLKHASPKGGKWK